MLSPRPLLRLAALLALLSAPAPAVRAAAGVTDATLRQLSLVADWQLRHPCNFDIRWRAPGSAELEHLRFAWDGTLLRRRKLPATEMQDTEVRSAWDFLASRAAGNLSFADLPPAVRAAWEKETGLDPRHIVRLRLMDEGATRGWEMATLYLGLLALDDVAAERTYREALRHLAEAQHWQLAPRAYHADDTLLGNLYLDFYRREKKLDQLAAVQARLDWIRAHPSTQPVDIRQGQDRWTWCDALFMAPPVWLQLWKATGDRGYLEFMDREWWATTDALYASDEHLFFRDANFLTRREPNGRRVFWSRGNGWVLASLALLLADLPEDLPARPKYARLFQEMAARIAALQPADGLWRSSLLDPAANPQPESSSTALFTYAFARGIRLGLLERATFQPVVDRGWAALQTCVDADGCLGFVQQPGAAPGSADRASTAPYGVGAFLLAGSEVYRLQAADAAH